MIELVAEGTCQLRAGLKVTRPKLVDVVKMWMSCGVVLGDDIVVKVKEGEAGR